MDKVHGEAIQKRKNIKGQKKYRKIFYFSIIK